MPSRRRLARIGAMQTIFERLAREIDPALSLAANLREIGGIDVCDHAFAETLTRGVIDHMQALTSAIEKSAPEWPIDRMDPLSRSILFIGAFELLILKEAPPAVIMNEAIEIAKEYGPAESPKFINGVLNALAHTA